MNTSGPEESGLFLRKQTNKPQNVCLSDMIKVPSFPDHNFYFWTGIPEA